MKCPFYFPQLVLVLLLVTQVAAAQGGGGEDTTKPPNPPSASPGPKPSPKPPKPPKPKPPTLASLTINSNVPDATVMINDRVGGKTDSNGNLQLGALKPGTYAVTVRKAGYHALPVRSVTLSAGQSQWLNFALNPVPGFLNVSTNLSGAQIEISGLGNYAGVVSNLALTPGSYHLKASGPGYRTTERDVQVTVGETTSVDLNLELVPVEEILAQAQQAYNNKNFDQVFSLANQALSIRPDLAQAHLLVGQSLASLGRFSESVDPLTKAISYGSQLRFDVGHRHYIFAVGEVLAPGVLTLDREKLTFTSSSQKRSNENFSIPVAKVAQVGTVAGGRLSMKVLLPKKNGKDDRKQYDFYLGRATTEQVVPQGSQFPMSVIVCENCDSEIQALAQLIANVRGR